MHARLSAAELTQFHDSGYVALPAFFSDDLMEGVHQEMLKGMTEEPWLAPAHGSLISYAPLMGIVEQLCGADFRFHHLNTYFQGEGIPGVDWHNDFEQSYLPMPRHEKNTNLIVLIYPGGLQGEVGDLVVVPGTHKLCAAWDAYAFLGTAHLPHEVVIDRVVPGTVVLCHTGLVHCRRPQPGPGPRYFCDVSYVTADQLWPASCQHDWKKMYADCLRLGYDQEGRYQHLFNGDNFVDPAVAQAQMQQLQQTDIYKRLLS